MKRLGTAFSIVLTVSMLSGVVGCGTDPVLASDIKKNWDVSEMKETGTDEDYFYLGNEKYTLYNSKYYDCFFEKEDYSLQEILEIVDANKGIPDKYKTTVKEYIETMYDYYPDLDWRVFVNNLKTLTFEVVEADNYEFSNVAARYLLDGSNLIQIREDMDLTGDEYTIRIFRHELGHVFNSLHYSEGNRSLTFKYNSSSDGKRGTSVLEAMDVIFTVDPFLDEYTDENLGYSIFTNIVREICDYTGYTAEDSISSNIAYFAELLELEIPEGKNAIEFIDNLDYFMEEASYERVKGDTSEIEYIYECVAEMYVAKYITEDMSEEEIMTREKELEERLILGAPHPEYVYTDVVEKVFKEYISGR